MRDIAALFHPLLQPLAASLPAVSATPPVATRPLPSPARRRLLPLLSVLLPLVLLAPAVAVHAQTANGEQADGGVAATSDAEDTANDAAETDPTAVRPAHFDPATVGLPGLPATLATSEDFARALELIDARIAELEAATPVADEPPVTDALADDAAPAAVRDPRLDELKAMRLAAQRGAALLERHLVLEDALRRREAVFAKQTETGLDAPPPYTVSLLDETRAERQLSAQHEAAADRRLDIAQERFASAERDLAAAERTRRQVRDRLAAADDDAERRAIGLELEAARLAELTAFHRQRAAFLQQRFAERERTLARLQSDQLEHKIQLLEGSVVFPRGALDERLADLAAHAEAVATEITAFQQRGDQVEADLYVTQRRLAQTQDPDRETALQEDLRALESELVAARKGADYLSEVAAAIATSRTLWERRFALLADNDPAAHVDWLRETRALLREVEQDQAFIEAEISGMRASRRTLLARLEEPGLEPAVRTTLRRRAEAIDAQQAPAVEMLVSLEALQRLAQHLEAELAPRVSERSLGDQLQQARVWLERGWDSEVLVIDDYALKTGELVTALVVFLLVLLAVSLLRVLLRRNVLPRLIRAAQAAEAAGPDANGVGAEVGGGAGRANTRSAFALAIARNTSLLFVLVVAFYVAMASSGLAQGQFREWLWALLVLAVYLQLGIWANAAAVNHFRLQRSRKERDDPSAVTGYGLMLFFIRITIWAMVLISALTYFKYPVAGLIGALGVTGIAVAFAVQTILSDVFSSMAIILDKPFRVGDFIMAGETLGVIEQIGVKTTRIRSLSGEQITMSNSNLLNTCIRNFKHMHERRVVFKLGVVYQTPPDKLERIPQIIRDIIRAQRYTRFDRAHFFEYGDFALLFEVVYYVVGPDYNRYMDIQQAINLAIYRAFQDQGVEFAYPTQELLIRRPTMRTLEQAS